MQRAATLIFVATCWILYSLTPAEAQESTTPSQDQYASGPDSECPGAKVVNTTSGNGDKQSPVFGITGDSFRVTTSLSTDSPQFLGFDIFVNKESGGFVTSIGRESPGTDSSIVNAGPGNFFLDILAANVDYVVTVEDCTGAVLPAPNPPQGSVNKPKDVVGPIPVKKMPPTGGLPIIVGVLALLAGSVIVGWAAMRR